MLTYVFASVILTRLRCAFGHPQEPLPFIYLMPFGPFRVKMRKDMNEKDKYTRGIHADALANWETIKVQKCITSNNNS